MSNWLQYYSQPTTSSGKIEECAGLFKDGQYLNADVRKNKKYNETGMIMFNT